ncbi:MAG: hypothetical protein Q8N47_00170 [Bryobacterales bacterium]|nr:hypothetical protein [Bryobacterales bacterium]
MLRLSAAPPVMIAAGRAAAGPYRHIPDSQWARALEVYTALEGGEIEQDARRRIETAAARRGGDLHAGVARLRCALKPEDRLGAGRVIRKHYQPSNVADLVHCQEFETAKPHGVFTLATHHMRQADAIKAGIKRLIAACDHALGRPAPAAIPPEMD